MAVDLCILAAEERRELASAIAEVAARRGWTAALDAEFETARLILILWSAEIADTAARVATVEQAGEAGRVILVCVAGGPPPPLELSTVSLKAPAAPTRAVKLIERTLAARLGPATPLREQPVFMADAFAMPSPTKQSAAPLRVRKLLRIHLGAAE